MYVLLHTCKLQVYISHSYYALPAATVFARSDMYQRNNRLSPQICTPSQTRTKQLRQEAEALEAPPPEGYTSNSNKEVPVLESRCKKQSQAIRLDCDYCCRAPGSGHHHHRLTGVGLCFFNNVQLEERTRTATFRLMHTTVFIFLCRYFLHGHKSAESCVAGTTSIFLGTLSNRPVVALQHCAHTL